MTVLDIWCLNVYRNNNNTIVSGRGTDQEGDDEDAASRRRVQPHPGPAGTGEHQEGCETVSESVSHQGCPPRLPGAAPPADR